MALWSEMKSSSLLKKSELASDVAKEEKEEKYDKCLGYENDKI